MKIKAIMCAAIAALAFASCSQDDDVTASVQPLDSKVITFNPSVQNAAGTRSTPVTPENYKTTMSDFAVFAVSSVDANVSNGVPGFHGDGEMFMGKLIDDKMSDPVTIRYEHGGWKYANPAEKAFWPKDKDVTFYAFSPADTKISPIISEGAGRNAFIFNVTVPTDVNKQKDIMFATTTIKNGQRVQLEFKHLLAQVSFKAQTSNNEIEVEVSEVKMANLKLQGVSSYMWKGAQPTLTIAALQDVEIGDVALGLKTPVRFDKSSGIISVTDNDGVAMVIPQMNYSSWAPGTPISGTRDYYLAIQCKIKYKGKYVVGSDSEYGTIYQPFAPNWESGKKYVYTLDFNGAGYDENGEVILKPISYGVSVTDWDASPGETAVNVN